MSKKSTTVSSTHCKWFKLKLSCLNQVSKKGVKIRTPTPSPNHQVTHNSAKLGIEVNPAKYKLTVPIVELIKHITGITQINTRQDFTVCKKSLTSENRCSSFAPTTCCIKEPAPIVKPARMEAVVLAIVVPSKKAWVLMIKAPSQIPPHARLPISSTMASAKPEGGHTAVTLPGEIANDCPNQPTKHSVYHGNAKYFAAGF